MTITALQGRALAFSVLCGWSLQASAESADWAKTLERISSAVVSLKVDVTRSFDTEMNASGQATGFVIRIKRIDQV